MSKDSILAKIDFIIKMIDDLEFVISKYQHITKALNDREGQLAILMCLLQIGENINKIDKEILKKYDLMIEAKGAYAVRNFIAHDYEGVQLSKIEEIIRLNNPHLKEKLNKIKIEV